jgi:hypothetical protein
MLKTPPDGGIKTFLMSNLNRILVIL